MAQDRVPGQKRQSARYSGVLSALSDQSAKFPVKKTPSSKRACPPSSNSTAFDLCAVNLSWRHKSDAHSLIKRGDLDGPVNICHGIMRIGHRRNHWLVPVDQV